MEQDHDEVDGAEMFLNDRFNGWPRHAPHTLYELYPKNGTGSLYAARAAIKWQDRRLWRRQDRTYGPAG